MPLGQHEESPSAMNPLGAGSGLEPAAEEAAENAGPGHLLFVWSPAGYELLSRAGAPPRLGDEVGVSGGPRVVTKVGPSPLPGDRRLCAFLDAAG